MPKWVYPLAFLFVLFLIFTQPAFASDVASGFATFLVNLLGAIGEFLTGLFEGASGESVTSFDPGSTSGRSADTADSFSHTFTHTHDGSTHTHTVVD